MSVAVIGIVKLAHNLPPNLSVNAILLSPKLFVFVFVSFVVELATTLKYQVASQEAPPKRLISFPS